VATLVPAALPAVVQVNISIPKIPRSLSPKLINNSTCSRTALSETFWYSPYQLFQPMGGFSAIWFHGCGETIGRFAQRSALQAKHADIIDKLINFILRTLILCCTTSSVGTLGITPLATQPYNNHRLSIQ
jgi:hypothetical protein